MQYIQQRQKLPIENLDYLDDEAATGVKNRRHGELLPNSFRALFIGPSNCGKTNALLALIYDPNGVRFENIYVYSKTLYQPKYKLLESVLNRVKGIEYFQFSNKDELIEPSEAKCNSVFIFDDVICEKQNKIREYYSMCRHKNIDAMFVAQTYTSVSKQLIRDNSNVIVLFRQDEKNLKYVYNEHVSPDMAYERFKELCCDCWRENYGCLVIIKDFPLDNGRFRKGFDQYIKV